MGMGKVKFAFLLIILHLCHVSAEYNTDHALKHGRAKNDITDTIMTLEDHVLADIERRLSSLESDNRRFTIKNQQIHKTNIDLKQEIQQGKAENQKLQKGVRRLEIENRHCMQVVKNIQETMRLLVEENQMLTKSNEMADRHDPAASQDTNGNIIKSKDVTWTAPTEAHNFSYSVPYSVLKSVSSAFQQAERSDSNGKQYTPDELNKNLDTDVIDSFVKDRPSMPVQRSNNRSIATASTQPRTVQSKSRKNARAAGPSAAVAFHARLSSDLTSPGDDQTIIMSDVLTNEGSAYERLSGHFTSPVSGVYAFFVTAVSFHDKQIETELLKNGHAIGSLVSGSSGFWGSSSNTVIVTAQIGDHFWVRVNGHFHDTGTVLDNYFTTFSGFLLY